MSLYLYSLGTDFWLDPEVRASVQQGLLAARRIEKGVEATRERTRLHSAMRGIERLARASGVTPRVLEGPQQSAALEALRRIGDTRISFREPDREGSDGFVLAVVPFSKDSVASEPVNAAKPADRFSGGSPARSTITRPTRS